DFKHMNRIAAPCRTAVLMAVVCLLSAGCQGFNFFSQANTRKDAVTKDMSVPPALAKPGRYSVRVAPYVFLADFELKKDDEMFRELAGLRDQVYRELTLPTSDRPVFVYLFEDHERYERYMQTRYPELPRRRAFFIAQPRP